MLTEREVWLRLYEIFLQADFSDKPYSKSAKSADEAIKEYEKRWGLAEQREIDPDFEDLWQEVVARARTTPYCMGSTYRAHVDAAHDLPASIVTTKGQAAWNDFVDRKTAGMSRFAGD